MKKLLSIFVIAVLLFGALSLAVVNNKAQAQDKYKIALVLSGFLGDESFNDSAHRGLKRAEEDFNIETTVLESDKSDEWEQNVISSATSDYDLVIGVSTQFEDIIDKNAPQFPDTAFALIDGAVDHPNVASAVFAQNEGSFLAGAAAAMFTQHDEIEGVNSDKKIGWVGGMDVPVLHDFLVGYKQGAKHIDPDVEVLNSFAGTFNDPVKGKELTLSQYDQGADIVMNVASGTGRGIIEAADEADKYAIGVDLNQDDIYPGNILTSMVKRVDRATYTIIESLVEDDFAGGEVVTMDLNNGGVELTDMSVMKEELGDDFPDEILDRIEELTEEIKNGEIEVDSYEGFSVE
ncbi:MAG: BMP family lipoprotein [Halanaerobiaceae bacterium]